MNRFLTMDRRGTPEQMGIRLCDKAIYTRPATLIDDEFHRIYFRARGKDIKISRGTVQTHTLWIPSQTNQIILHLPPRITEYSLTLN